MLRFIGSSLFVLVFNYALTHAQKTIRELPKNINQPSVNLYAPFISGDGQSMVYLSDYTDDGHHVMYFATKKSVSTWNDGVEIDKVINRPTHNFRGGYSLNFDGSVLLYTSRKSGLGGYEIWYSERNGSSWGTPKNMGGPVNSASNEGSPMISPDGQYLYFMRCETMSEYQGATGCKLMVSKRKYDKWEEPEELPSNINTGNSQTPRILADGETLLFASDQFGGKGNLDIYLTRKLEDGWSDPEPMDFINDEWNNAFVSVPAKGRYMFADIKGSRSRAIAQVLIPKEYQPKDVMRIQGEVVDVNGAPLNANLTVFNINERKRLWNEEIGNTGQFTLVLNQGASYDLAISTDQENMYYSKVYVLDSIGPRDKEKLKITIEPIELNKTYPTQISFEPYTAELSDNATFELRRLADLMRKSDDMKMEISVHLNQYYKDSVHSHDDLTEVIIDSILVKNKVPIELEVVEYEDEIELDSVLTSSVRNEALEAEKILEDANKYDIAEELQLKYTYHNDRTQKQGERIKEYLIGRGIGENRISVVVSREQATTEMSEGKKIDNDPEVSFTIRGM